ncbi:MAG: exodeoxyribonuclease VII large subunit [bacterium]
MRTKNLNTNMNNSLFDDKRVFTIGEINKISKDMLEGAFSNIWVQGEISNYKLHSMGHMYFTLKDEEGQISAVMYKGYTSQLRFTPGDGLKVLLRGKLSIYLKRGQYQIVAYEMQPAGKGALQLAFEQLKEKLSKEGLFDQARKRPLPFLPQKIGVITSPTGAAIRDILSVIGRRFANVEILINPVRVQGDEAPQEIVNAIEEMNKNFPELDVLIVGRGGGSLEDLWGFNDERVARAIYTSKLPVISAVGHEIDFTISDFVADVRAATPSAAAELVVKNKEDIVKTVEYYRNRLKMNLEHLYEKYHTRYQRVIESKIFRKPVEYINQLQQEVDDLTEQIRQSFAHFVEIKKKEFHLFTEKLSILNPLSILARGYSVTYKMPQETIVKDSEEVSTGDSIKIKLNKGELICDVKEKR